MSKYFFEQPNEVKEKYLKVYSKSHHGYVKAGQEL